MRVTFIRPSMSPHKANDAMEPLAIAMLAAYDKENIDYKLRIRSVHHTVKVTIVPEILPSIDILYKNKGAIMTRLISLIAAVLLLTSVSAASMNERLDYFRSNYVQNKQGCLQTLDELVCVFAIMNVLQVVDKNDTVMPGPASGGTIDLDESLVLSTAEKLKKNEVAIGLIGQYTGDQNSFDKALMNATYKDMKELLEAFEAVNRDLQNL